MKITSNIIEINQPPKLMLTTGSSFRILELDQITYLKTWGNYTEIYLTNNKKIVLSNSIATYEEHLTQYHFYRIHKTNLVNLNHIEQYNHKTKKIKLKNGEELEVARRKYKDLINEFYQRTIIPPTSPTK